MAVVVSSNSGKWHYAIKHFICDVAADVQDLPIDGVWPGSTAYIVDTCESYIFNSSREWIKITNNSSGSGGGLAATIQVGNVTTGQPGSDVTITNSGTASAAVFDFSIPRGEPFQIKEVYDSIAAMEADYNNPDLNVGDLVAIVSDPSDPDNASLYVKGDTQFEFFMDLSGAQGIQGPAGPQGEKGDAFTYSDFSPAQLESLTGPRGPQGPEGNGISNITQNPNGTLTITMDDGDQYIVDVEAFIDKMDKTNPIGTGYFSLNRKSDTTIGTDSFAEGHNTTASGTYSHAEGQLTTASATDAHAEGYSTTASGNHSHAEGYNTAANSDHSHAEGYNTIASGSHSHVEGQSTKANHRSQHVFGEYNIEDPSTASALARGNYVEIVGNGTSTSARSNARTLDWSGNETLAGNLTIGGTPTNDDHAATKKYVDDAVADATELPETSVADAGDVLMVNDEGEWAMGEIFIPQEVPTPTSENIGKVVTVVSDGDEGVEYGLETINIPESGILNFISAGVIVTDSNFNAVFAFKPIDVKNAIDAGKDVRLIAKITQGTSFTKDGKKVYFLEDDLIVFKFMGRIQNGSGADYSFRSVSVYDHPANIAEANLKGDLIINFTNKLTSTSAGFQTQAKYDVSKLETRS